MVFPIPYKQHVAISRHSPTQWSIQEAAIVKNARRNAASAAATYGKDRYIADSVHAVLIMMMIMNSSLEKMLNKAEYYLAAFC